MWEKNQSGCIRSPTRVAACIFVLCQGHLPLTLKKSLLSQQLDVFYWGNDFYLCASVSALVLWLSNKDVRTFVGEKTNKNNKNARFILIAAISGKKSVFLYSVLCSNFTKTSLYC